MKDTINLRMWSKAEELVEKLQWMKEYITI